MFFDLANETNDFKHALKSKFCYSDVPNCRRRGAEGAEGAGWYVGGGRIKCTRRKIIKLSIFLKMEGGVFRSFPYNN